MFTDVNSFLNFDSQTISSENLPTGLIGICERFADGSFLIHHFLSYLLRTRDPVCLVSFTQSLNHFSSVGNKIGCNLTTHSKEKLFVFIDGLKLLQPLGNRDGTEIHNKSSFVDIKGQFDIHLLLEFITGHLEALKLDFNKYPHLIIDDLSILIALGCPVKDVMFFIHYLRSCFMANRDQHVFVVRVSNDLEDEDEDNGKLWKYIQHSSNMSLVVSGLDTGYCRDVHGQVIKLLFLSMSRYFSCLSKVRIIFILYQSHVYK